jgi:hypothetical protein
MVKRGSKRIISLPEFFGFAVLNEHQLNFLQGPQAEPKRTLKSGPLILIFLPLLVLVSLV